MRAQPDSGCIMAAIYGVIGVMMLLGCGMVGLAGFVVVERFVAPTTVARVIGSDLIVSPTGTKTFEEVPVATIAPTAGVLVPVATVAPSVSEEGPVATVAPPADSPSVMLPLVAGADPMEGCFCTADVLNCGETAESRAEGRRCYAVCNRLGYGDVHQLDGNDQDGLACED